MLRPLGSLRFDKNNVPILKPMEIDDRAEYMLSIFSERSLAQPEATDLNAIIKRLIHEHGVRFIFTEDLGQTAQGAKIRGRIALRERIVWIDRSLSPQNELHRFRFTVAHELGHLALHRHRRIKNYDTIDDTNEQLRMQFNHTSGSRQIVEWQACRYASAVLMPQYTTVLALLAFHRENNVRRNRGKVYVDNTPTNRKLYAETLNHLGLVFHVSRTVARIRLEELGLLVDRREERAKGLANELERMWKP